MSNHAMTFIQNIFIMMIRAYQLIISPLFPSSCRHTPSCSNYMIIAIREHGAFHGVWLGIKRIVKCNPLGTSGHDPVPKRKSCKC